MKIMYIAVGENNHLDKSGGKKWLVYHLQDTIFETYSVHSIISFLWDLRKPALGNN